MNSLKFTKDQGYVFYETLRSRVNDSLSNTQSSSLKYKTAFYLIIFSSSYLSLFHIPQNYEWCFYALYIIMMTSALLMVFNIAHDAAHNSIFRNKRWNEMLYMISFIHLGNHPYVWRKYHIQSHHLYTNVEGSDIDVIKNPIVRLNESDKIESWHKYQHLYAVFIYIFYSINFLILRDVFSLIGKSDRTIKIQLTIGERIKYILTKVYYFTFYLCLPIIILPFSWMHILFAFFIGHCIISIIIILVLAGNHQSDLVEHFEAREEINISWASLQMRTSLDYDPDSRILNFFLGGFNAHTVHHLFPHVPHTYYPRIVPIIRKTAKEFGLHYNETSSKEALKSHFRYLKLMGNGNT